MLKVIIPMVVLTIIFVVVASNFASNTGSDSVCFSPPCHNIYNDD